MLWSWLPLLMAIVAVVNAEAYKIDSSLWKNTHYYRNVDLSSPYVKDFSLVEVENISSEPQQVYIFPVNDGFDAIHDAAHFEVLHMERKIQMVYVKLAPGVFAVNFPEPVAPGSKVEFKAVYSYTGALTPFPAKINIDEPHNVLIQVNKFCYSPYLTEDYSLAFTGLSKGQEMDLHLDNYTTPGLPELTARVEKEAGALTYGPVIADIPPFSVTPLGLVYDRNRPITRAHTLERSFWLPASDSHVVQTEDYYELTNDAAELKSGYSRGDWMKGRYDLKKEHFALSQLEFPIDPKAPFDNYYFTDKVGMVSSHQVTHGHIVMQPRYPLFGGWKYNFTMGWSNKMEAFVRETVDDRHVYIAKFPLLNNLRDIYYDNVTINFYLPENAKYIGASAVVPTEDREVGAEASYLDVSGGHVKVSLKFSDVADDLAHTFVYVKYSYSPVSYWLKVGKIAGFVFVGLLSYYLLGLVDVSIKN